MSKCRVATQPEGAPCLKPASYIVTFADDTRIPACVQCTLALRQTAGAHGTNLKVEKIP